jgi:hypothetical protein
MKIISDKDLRHGLGNQRPLKLPDRRLESLKDAIAAIDRLGEQVASLNKTSLAADLQSGLAGLAAATSSIASSLQELVDRPVSQPTSKPTRSWTFTIMRDDKGRITSIEARS